MSRELYWIKVPGNIAVPGKLLLIPFRKLVDLEYLNIRRVEELPPGLGELIYLNDDTAIFVDSFSGQKSFFIASMFYASGTEEIYFLGTTGAIGDYKPGTVVIPEEVAASFGFLGTGEFELMKVESDMKDAIDSFGPITGRVLTVFSPVEEDPDFIQRVSEMGFNFLEMELFPLFRASKLYGRKAGAVLVVSDNFKDGKWQPFFKHGDFKRVRREVFRRIVDFILEV